MTSFDNELKFEAALIELLHTRYGWEKEVLVNPTEEQLIANWAKIGRARVGKECRSRWSPYH